MSISRARIQRATRASSRSVTERLQYRGCRTRRGAMAEIFCPWCFTLSAPTIRFCSIDDRLFSAIRLSDRTARKTWSPSSLARVRQLIFYATPVSWNTALGGWFPQWACRETMYRNAKQNTRVSTRTRASDRRCLFTCRSGLLWSSNLLKNQKRRCEWDTGDIMLNSNAKHSNRHLRTL